MYLLLQDSNSHLDTAHSVSTRQFYLGTDANTEKRKRKKRKPPIYADNMTERKQIHRATIEPNIVMPSDSINAAEKKR